MAEDVLGAALVHYSGSREHVAQLAERARVRGLRLTPAGIVDGNGRVRPAASEADLYAALDLPWIPPERRHGLDEIALAERGAFPPAVAVADIQGDLHMHTLWSDGRDTTEAVIRSARALGYRYLAITDHSPTSKASRTLSIEGIAQQARRDRRRSAAYPELTILHGCEVDILPDGSLDLPDPVMAGLDIVLASLHDAAGQPPDRLLRALPGRDGASPDQRRHPPGQPDARTRQRLRPRVGPLLRGARATPARPSRWTARPATSISTAIWRARPSKRVRRW